MTSANGARRPAIMRGRERLIGASASGCPSWNGFRSLSWTSSFPSRFIIACSPSAKSSLLSGYLHTDPRKLQSQIKIPGVPGISSSLFFFWLFGKLCIGCSRFRRCISLRWRRLLLCHFFSNLLHRSRECFRGRLDCAYIVSFSSFL
jgi:hypothetical protein